MSRQDGQTGWSDTGVAEVSPVPPSDQEFSVLLQEVQPHEALR